MMNQVKFRIKVASKLLWKFNSIYIRGCLCSI